MAKGRQRGGINLGVAIDRETHLRLVSICDRRGISQAVFIRELLNKSLGTGGPAFSRGWLEGYRAAYAAVMGRFAEAVAIEQAAALNGAATGLPDDE